MVTCCAGTIARLRFCRFFAEKIKVDKPQNGQAVTVHLDGLYASTSATSPALTFVASATADRAVR